MPALIVLQGPRTGEKLPLKGPRSRIGRDPEGEICLASHLVSRHHAAIICEGDRIFVEDLGSRNGTLLNGKKIDKREPFTAVDQLSIGEYVLGLVPHAAEEENLQIRERVEANISNQSLFSQNPVQTLQTVLEITQALSDASDVPTLCDNVLDRLLRLFPRADRGLILTCEKDKFIVRAQKARRGKEQDFPYSRTIVKKSLEDGVSILSDDLGADTRFSAAQSIRASNTRSLMCVPLISKEGRRLGVVQLEQGSGGLPFHTEDLQLLTTLCLQIGVVLDNVAAQAERLRSEVYFKELSVARDVQMGYLPTDFAPRPGYQIVAGIQPARNVSGDLYDFFPLPGGKLAFLVGDVSGKGLPAAMFMIAVRTLARHIAPAAANTVDLLTRLNDALADDNPSMMFVTLCYGIFDPTTGDVAIASGGHPAPLLSSPDGSVSELALNTGPVLGFNFGAVTATELCLTLTPGQTLALYSDGYSEAFAPDSDRMFGVEGITAALKAVASRPLADVAAHINNNVTHFTGGGDIQDDQTLLLLRRL